jgi:hypothetical protein
LGLEQHIYEEVGHPFNIGSPKQLGEVLFEEMSIPPVRKTKTGYSTDAKVLQQLAIEHPIADRIIEYRELTKLRGTYIDGLVKLISTRAAYTAPCSRRGPPRAASPATRPTCRTSPSAPRWACASGTRSPLRRDVCW